MAAPAHIRLNYLVSSVGALSQLQSLPHFLEMSPGFRHQPSSEESLSPPGVKELEYGWSTTPSYSEEVSPV